MSPFSGLARESQKTAGKENHHIIKEQGVKISPHATINLNSSLMELLKALSSDSIYKLETDSIYKLETDSNLRVHSERH